MSEVLVDTSVWILFFNGGKSPEVDFLQRSILKGHPLYLCPIIIQGILQGIRSDKDYNDVKDSLLAFPIPDWSPIQAAIEAAKIYRGLRKKGITIRKSNDCLIAAYARQFNLAVLYKDRDFSIMAEQGILRTVSLSKE